MLMRRAKGWIGVDIGTCSIKMAQVERHGGQVTIREAATVRRPIPWEESTTLQWSPRGSQAELASARALGEQFTGRASVAMVPMAVAELRNLRVAEPNEASVQHALHTAAPAETTDRLHERVVDFWPIAHPTESQTVALDNVSVLSVAKAWSLQIANDLSATRLRCCAIDGLPLALARATSLTEDIPVDAPVAVLDWGFTCATFCIVYQGAPLFVRRLRECGFGQLVERVREALSVSWEEAAGLTEEHAVGRHQTAPTAKLICELVTDRLSHLVEELERTMTYLRAHRKLLLPKHLLLFGGGATTKQIDRFLTEKIRLATREWTLGDSRFCSQTAGSIPTTLLGPAVALSLLALETQ